MVMQMRPRAARRRQLSQSLPKKDSGLTLRIKFISAAAHIFLPQRTQKSAGNLFDHDVGTGMSVLEIVIFSLILVWAPGLIIGAYLTWGSPRVD
jgi:hypothetical protein